MSDKNQKKYTVSQLAKLSGVSDRTLRFYDEIGLLKPASIGENGYRYYEKDQLLVLQQILFYRELGFELSMIQKIILNPEFDKIAALKAHREQLDKETKRTKALIKTIDKTLDHLQKELPMKDREIYLGFDAKKQAAYEREIVERWGEAGKRGIEQSRQRTKNWKKEDYEKVQRDYDELHKAFTSALKKGLKANDQEVQGLVKRHFAIVDRFWTPKQESYIGLGKTYCEHQDFRKLYDSYHPQLAEYLSEAMKVFAEENLESIKGSR